VAERRGYSMVAQKSCKAYGDMQKIKDLLEQAAEIFSEMPIEVRTAAYESHADDAALAHCLRWGVQAAEDLVEDWCELVGDVSTGRKDGEAQ